LSPLRNIHPRSRDDGPAVQLADDQRVVAGPAVEQRKADRTALAYVGVDQGIVAGAAVKRAGAYEVVTCSAVEVVAATAGQVVVAGATIQLVVTSGTRPRLAMYATLRPVMRENCGLM